jgi:NADPH2:quinone reductase
MRHTRIIVTHYGGPDALRVVEEERPEPKDGEVRVRVSAAGVALPDVLAREGVHPETPPVPFTPGWDLVGVVDRPGDGVSGFESNRIVAAMPIHGAYAEFVCLPQHELVPVPSGLDAAEAVSLVLNYVTAYQMLHRSAKVRPGQRVLIHGAAGGVGSALLQLGRLAGLEMYGTCSSRGRRPFPTWVVSRLIISIRTSWKRFTALRARAWMLSLTPSGEPTSGNPAGLSVAEGR